LNSGKNFGKGPILVDIYIKLKGDKIKEYEARLKHTTKSIGYKNNFEIKKNVISILF